MLFNYKSNIRWKKLKGLQNEIDKNFISWCWKPETIFMPIKLK